MIHKRRFERLLHKRLQHSGQYSLLETHKNNCKKTSVLTVPVKLVNMEQVLSVEITTSQ